MTEKQINAQRLFLMSCIALIATAMTFAIRARLEPIYGELFGLNKEQIGWAYGTAFWGFTLAQFIGGPLVDLIGMKRFVRIAFFLHLIGIVVTIFARDFWTLFYRHPFYRGGQWQHRSRLQPTGCFDFSER